MKFNLKRLKKPVIYFIGGIIGIYVIVGLYSLIFEQDKLAMDRYSFEQLNLVENTLKDISKENYNFNNLQEFNSIYTKQIKPLNNCYYIKDTNRFLGYSAGGEGYIFAFQFESLIYKLLYFNWYYINQKYQLPIDIGYAGGQTDKTYNYFSYVITNPCKD